MIVAVVTAFRPDISLLENVAAIRSQVDHVVVVDDGSGPDADSVLDLLASAGDTVLRSPSNEGIASALNRGVRSARQAGATAVLTLDQDSAVRPGFVEELVAAHRLSAQVSSPVGFIVPEYFASVRQSLPGAAGPVLRADYRAIQSGMLIPVETLTAVGEFREDLFIDLVDLEFVLRCEDHGLPGVAAPGLRLEHSLGAQYENRLFGVRLPIVPSTLTLSTPFRYYYRARNRIIVNRSLSRGARSRLRRDTLIDGLHFVNAVLVARPRVALATVLIHAVRDARAQRLGRAPEKVRRLASGITWRVPRIPAK
ncbi:MAG: glycosyltransferase [Mycetocola sp.]